MIEASTRLAGRSGGRGSAGVLPCKHGGLAAGNRQFVEAALRIARTGALWRDPHPSSSSVASNSLAVVRSSDLALR
jgi:hypothetical protein